MPLTSPPPPAKPPCRHCGGRAGCRPRGLCLYCYRDPAVRAQYPSTSKHAPHATPAPECWSCAQAAPRRVHLQALGWGVQVIRFHGETLREVLCPRCWQEYGFPPVMEVTT